MPSASSRRSRDSAAAADFRSTISRSSRDIASEAEVDVSVDVVRVRYRAGLVGEARRVVHLALWHEGFRTL